VKTSVRERLVVLLVVGAMVAFFGLFALSFWDWMDENLHPSFQYKGWPGFFHEWYWSVGSLAVSLVLMVTAALLMRKIFPAQPRIATPIVDEQHVLQLYEHGREKNASVD